MRVEANTPVFKFNPFVTVSQSAKPSEDGSSSIIPESMTYDTGGQRLRGGTSVLGSVYRSPQPSPSPDFIQDLHRVTGPRVPCSTERPEWLRSIKPQVPRSPLILGCYNAYSGEV